MRGQYRRHHYPRTPLSNLEVLRGSTRDGRGHAAARETKPRRRHRPPEGKTDKETTQLNTQGLLMEGLRLLDESQREGSADAVEDSSASASAAPSADTSTSAGIVAGSGSGGTEEEEDVLLDN